MNNINLHIYQGEALGIIGEPESSKERVGRILSGEIKPDKGKVVRKTDLFYADMQDRSMQDNTVLDYVKNAVLLFPYKASEHKVEQILKYAHLTEAETTKINELTDEAYARLLFTLARTSNANILIFNQVITHLDETFLSVQLN